MSSDPFLLFAFRSKVSLEFAGEIPIHLSQEAHCCTFDYLPSAISLRIPWALTMYPLRIFNEALADEQMSEGRLDMLFIRHYNIH